MKTKLCYSSILAILVLLASCSPAPVLRLTPTAGDTSWLDGKEYMRSTAGGLEVAVAFEGIENNLILFEIFVGNETGQQVTISPERFYYVPLLFLPDSFKVDSLTLIVHAIDPETKILDLDKQIEQEKTSYANAAGIDAVFCFLGFLVDVATIGKTKSKEEIESEELQEREEDLDRREREINHANRLTEIKATKERWATTSLRRTTLASGESIAGRIHFQATPKANFVILFIEIEGAPMQFVFSQKKHKV